MMSEQRVDVEHTAMILLSFLKQHLLCGPKTKATRLFDGLIDLCLQVKNIVKIVPWVMLLLFFLITQSRTMK